jgi:hypothetical protein
MGLFWAVLMWMADRGECSRRKCFTVFEQARRVYYGSLFKAKMEILA